MSVASANRSARALVGDGSSTGPLIAEVKGNSLDDGPGIRSVVFVKGCPLDCAWCHNPEMKRPGPELAFDRARCVGAGHCTRACTEGALESARAGLIDRGRCTACMACAESCPSGALSAVGRYWELDELVARLLRDEPFYRISGGGVTLSGGEPALFPQWCGELLARLRARGIHTLLETCGHFPLARYVEQLAPSIDIVYFDIKLLDEQAHRHWCGRSNRRLLENFAALAEHAASGGPTLVARIPLVPGVTDTDENLDAAAALLRRHRVRKLALLPYHALWHDKAARIGARVRYEERHSASAAEIERCRRHFSDFGPP